MQVWRQSWSYNVLHCMLVVKFNLILLTHVITICPKCNKLLKVITLGPKCFSFITDASNTSLKAALCHMAVCFIMIMLLIIVLTQISTAPD